MDETMTAGIIILILMLVGIGAMGLILRRYRQEPDTYGDTAAKIAIISITIFLLGIWKTVDWIIKN